MLFYLASILAAFHSVNDKPREGLFIFLMVLTMRLLILLLLFPSYVFAAANWLNAGSLKTTAAEQEAACSARNEVVLGGYAYKVDPYKLNNVDYYQCLINSSPCDLPQVWDQVTRSCRQPCGTQSIGQRTYSPEGFVVCVAGCAVTQTSDSSCTGTAAEGGTCTATFSNTGSFCPNTSPDNSTPTDPNSGGSSSAGSSSSSSSSGGGDTGGGDTGGGDTGGGDTGGGNTGGGDTGGGDEPGQGSSTGGGNCDAPPECVAGPDAISCAILLQEWHQRCPVTDLLTGATGDGDGVYQGTDHTLDIGARLQDAKDRYAEKINDMTNDLTNSLSMGVSGGGALQCPTGEIFGTTIYKGICARLDFLNMIASLFYAVFAVLSAYVILSK